MFGLEDYILYGLGDRDRLKFRFLVFLWLWLWLWLRLLVRQIKVATDGCVLASTALPLRKCVDVVGLQLRENVIEQR